MNTKRNALGHGGGDVLKRGVSFPSGKWQSQSQRGRGFRFQFHFGHVLGLVA